jgi:exo-beta-1,3-glucanase (GH17 family)
MNTRNIRARQREFALRALCVAAAGAATLGLAGCGGNGDSGGYTPQAVSQTSDRRELPQSLLTRSAINYSPYRTSSKVEDLSKEVITAANVLQDLRLIQATGIGSIRLFSSRAFARTVLEVIRDNNLDLVVQLGTYPNPVTGPAAEADNMAELNAGIALANAFPTIVVAVSVGNETMVEWSAHKVAVADMARYIKHVRSAIRQPVTTNDNWLFWASVPKAIAEVVDYAAVHVYPFLDTFYNPTAYDWRQKSVAEPQRAQAMMDATLAEAKAQFNRARKGLELVNLGSLPMVIGETGWAAVDTAGGPNLAFRAHPVNQKIYFDALQQWAREGRRDAQGPKAIFLFQAFDEPWKQGDDGWGLFNARREARYAVQSLGTCGVTWTCEAGNYTAADAVKWVPPTLNAAVTANRYTLFADTVVAGENRATGLRWDPFASTSYRETNVGLASPDGGVHFEVTPTPVDYGWGLFNYSGTGVTTNLSNFANGQLKFQVRSDGYPGKLEVGISTDTEDRDGQEAYLQIAPGQFGYCNTNSWCEVSIPISAFVAANPKLDLRYVNFRFIVADRFSFTGKPLNQTGLPNIRIDGLHWSR